MILVSNMFFKKRLREVINDNPYVDIKVYWLDNVVLTVLSAGCLEKIFSDWWFYFETIKMN